MLTPETFDAATRPKAILLKWSESDGHITVIPENEDRFSLRIGNAIDMLRRSVEAERYKEQFYLLLNVLADWISRQKGVKSSFVTLRDGALLYLVVKSDIKYDREFEDSLSELDLQIANDTDLSLIELHTMALPDAGDEAIDSFLDSTMILEYEYGN